MDPELAGGIIIVVGIVVAVIAWLAYNRGLFDEIGSTGRFWFFKRQPEQPEPDEVKGEEAVERPDAPPTG